MYCTIMGDIIDSRKIKDGRSVTQEKFKAAINNININYEDNIESNFRITSGDGFYGLLNSPKKLLSIILEIRLAIAPNQIRMGIGIGNISTKIMKYQGDLIDGGANSSAKEAMDYLSENRNKYESVYRTTLLKIDNKEYDKFTEMNNEISKEYKQLVSKIDEKYKGQKKLIYTINEKCREYEKFINAIFCAYSGIEKKWDIIHADTIMLKVKGHTQREIAEQLGISQPAVQKRLALADYNLHEYYTEIIESAIAELWKGLNYA